MAGNPPEANELRQGMTVEIVQSDQNVKSEDKEPLIGEVGNVLGEDPEGPEVELKSGAVGHVQSVVTDE
ncbi:DUF2196 domain-containing protein [Halobacteria archaeon AArc-m2/3/4]|uniref:DUF2196 domain-containing protein n=1 Tax=Natronoglomus mannanivorans TaxID=2979990 RepID=A0ABT2QDA2_9EURY|nr:DUF2196 domain-containing protein [Halobacteria archaeon AArc-m2/3/4]